MLEMHASVGGQTKESPMSSKTPRLARYADKAPTDLQKRFTKWIKKETGVDVDEQSVALSVALRMEFQRSEENQAVLKSNREKAVAAVAAKAARKAAPTPAKDAAKPSGKRRKPVAAKPDTHPHADEPEGTGEAPIEAAPERPEPQFDDAKADAAVEASQKQSADDAPKPARRTRSSRSKATMVSGS